MPPSIPPACAVSRRYSRASASQVIASCATLPRTPAIVMPSPISTAFIAWMLISAWAEQTVDAPVPVHVRAEAGRQAVAQHLDHAAERVAGLRGLLDLADHVGLGVGIEAAHLRASRPARGRPGRGRRVGRGGRGTELDDVAQHRDLHVREQRLGDRAGRDARRGLARARRVRARRERRRSRTSASRRDRRGPGGAGSRATAVRPGADDISSAHFPVAHSLLRIRMASGLPSVRPWRTPPRNSTSSFSKRIRGPRP